MILYYWYRKQLPYPTFEDGYSMQIITHSPEGVRRKNSTPIPRKVVWGIDILNFSYYYFSRNLCFYIFTLKS